MKVAFAYALTVFLLSFIISIARGNVYGVIEDISTNNGTTTTMFAVEINTSTGDFTYLTKTFKYFWGSLAHMGISGFDQKRGNLYYAVNHEAGFIYSVNVNTSTVQPPISIDANSIQNFVYDYTNDNMYVSASYKSQGKADNYIIISLSLDSKPDSLLLNLTQQGIVGLGPSAMDYTTGTYFMVVGSFFASFNVQDPQNVFTTKVACPETPNVIYLAYNYKAITLIGVGEGSKPSVHYSFLRYTVKGDTVMCTATKIPLKEEGLVTGFSLDLVEEILYIGYISSGKPSLVMYDINTNSVSSVPVPFLLLDVQVSFAPPTFN